MASTILLRTISAVDDKRIVMNNTRWARPIPFGTTWTKLRFGIRYGMRDSGSGLTGTPQLVMGICSGSTNIYGDSTTTHFVGVRPTATTWARNAGPPPRYDIGSTPLFPCKKVGSTLTTGGTAFFNGNALIIGAGAASASADRSVLFVDITKGSPNFTIQLFGNNSIVTDVSLTNFLIQMETQGTPILTGHSQSAALTLAVSEADGNLDHLNMHWNVTIPEIEISDIAVARLA